jgi:hypothetical protein
VTGSGGAGAGLAAGSDEGEEGEGMSSMCVQVFGTLFTAWVTVFG